MPVYRLDDGILSQNDTRICSTRATLFDATNYSNSLRQSSFKSRELDILIDDISNKVEQ